MAEGDGAFMLQFIYLFRLVLRLKSWKFLVWLILIPTFFLNYYVFKNIEDKSQTGVASVGITELTIKKALSYKTLVETNAAERQTLKTIMSDRQGDTQNWFEDCNSPQQCKSKLVASTLRRSDAISSIMIFGGETKSKFELYCLNEGVAQILCPFLYQAMSQSMEPSTAVFKDVVFAKYYDKYGDNNNLLMGANMKMNWTRPDSMCTRTMKTFAYMEKFFLGIIGHMLLMAAGFILNFTVGTLSCISNLKENGFLQLVFNNGLSVSVFWLVFWTFAILESLVFTILFMTSYATQCPGFYTSDQSIKQFFTLMAFFMSFAAFGYLFATLIPSFFIVLLLMIIVTIAFALVMVVTKLFVMNPSFADKAGLVQLMLFLFPPGHVLEVLINQMLPDKFLKPNKAFDSYISMVNPVFMLAPFFIISLTIYIDFIVKDGNGMCLPYGFPISPNFWNPSNQKLIEMVDNQPARANVEPTKGIPAVIADDVKMTYPSGACGPKRPPVLKGVTCTVYQGQITALIGHNGAGKTTLIRVLMGEEIPTSGLVVINGLRVTDPYQRLALRGSVSICKQVDVLSNYLTVMESMELTLVAKGFSVDSQVNKVLDMMKRLGLAGKENVQAMDLSGGQMRKVCSIICLLGNPKLVILDEPTSGLDPVSRRNLWQILKEHKAGRSIILCTQFMDEADILADRKMFLSAGKMICAGSSLFLKHAFGCCMTINVSLKSENMKNKLMSLLKKVKLISQSTTELVLQMDADKPKFLADAVQTLEQQSELVEAFGVSQAQLDDIFMRLKSIDMDNIEESFKSKKLRKLGKAEVANIMNEKVDFNSLYSSENRKTVHSTLTTQFSALLLMNLKRQWKAKMKFCFRIIFPLLLVIAIAFLGMKSNSEANKGPENKKDSGIDESDMPSQKSVVLTNINSTDVTKSFNPAGICIYDEDSKSDDIHNRTTKLCNLLFYNRAAGAFAKPKTKSVTEFIQEKKINKMLRSVTMNSLAKFTFTSVYAYASSWERDSKNSDRVIHIGFFENPAESPDDIAAAQALYSSYTYYLTLATYFQAYQKTSEKKFTQASGYIIQTFTKMKFSECHELVAYAAAFALIPVTYLNDPIEDKDSGVRQHLASMGMSTIAYWVNTFIMHWMHYAICVILMSCAITIVQWYSNSFFIINLAFPALIFGTTSSQLSVYVVSALLKKTNAIILVLYFFFAMFLGIGVIFFQDNYTILFLLMLFIPPATPLAYVIMGAKILTYTMLFYDVKKAGDLTELSSIYSSSDILLTCVVMMPIHISILLGIIMLIENPDAILAVISKPIEVPKGNHKPPKDEGVQIEANRINKTIRDPANMLEVRDLQKIYPNGVHAVRGTTYGVFAGEIIGLLGPNGAGKSTSMSIIVGEEAQSSGTSEVHFAGAWMSGMDGAKGGAIGYCPQHNPLFNQISVEDHLVFYAKIRGIQPELAKAQVAGLIDGLGLKPHKEKAAEQLSGGNKRRLCLAIALLGNPSLVVIDEASTGVDPENKRFIWAAIRGMASKERSVMITTHSMEEVEALCSRVGIQNKGLMIAFGTVQQLRSRHGEAYTLDVLMKVNQSRNLDMKKKKLAKKIARQFPNATIMEDLMRCMQFNLPRQDIPSFSGAVRWLITKKKSLGIQFFSMYQMSLDQVFVKLVKEYDESL